MTCRYFQNGRCNRENGHDSRVHAWDDCAEVRGEEVESQDWREIGYRWLARMAGDMGGLGRAAKQNTFGRINPLAWLRPGSRVTSPPPLARELFRL